MGYTKNDLWPFLIIDSSTEMLDTTEVQGKDAIIKYFQEKGLMQDVKSHSAYEKQGFAWIEEKVS